MAQPEEEGPASRIGDWIQTFTGRMFWPMDPRAEDVRIEDIAHALALINRFNGHSFFPVSVAQHSVLVSQHVPPELALVGLLHDAAEAYCGDMVAPLKRSMANFKSIEREIALTIGEAFHLGDQLADLPAAVKHADLAALATEARQNTIMGLPAKPWRLAVPPFPETIPELTWRQAEALFLARLKEITTCRS